MRKQLLSRTVDDGKSLLSPRAQLTAVAVGIHGPCLFFRKHSAASYVPRRGIFFKQIAFVVEKRGQPRFDHADHIAAKPSVGLDIEKGGNKTDRGIGRKGASFRQEARNSVTAQGGVDHAAAASHIPRHHANVGIAGASPNQLFDQGSAKLSFLVGIGTLNDTNRLGNVFFGVGESLGRARKQIFLNSVKGTSLRMPKILGQTDPIDFQRIIGNLLCHADYGIVIGSDLAEADVVAVLSVQREGHGQFGSAVHHGAKDPLLMHGEGEKGIHKAGFVEYIAKLSAETGREIKTSADVCAALTDRIEFFDAHGCRAADHGLDYLMCREVSENEADAAFKKALDGETLTREEAEGYQTAVLLHCAREYYRLGWVMQLHFSCMRNPNSRMMSTLGPDTGFDCIAVTDSCAAAYRLMDALEREQKLPKTILYSLNPADNAWIDTLLGAFQSSEIPGKIQHGSAWWFNDHKTGMTEQLISLGNLGILGNFVGMLTDSRSLLSYARHEYFRRILCALFGRWVENGEYPADIEFVGSLVQDICYNNAKRYFGL